MNGAILACGRRAPGTLNCGMHESTMPTPSAKHLVVLDACVLMSGVLRPALLTLAEAGLFMPLWSERIGLEWRRNAARLWDIPLATLETEWELMKSRFPRADAGDVTPYETGLRYSDAKDWHVIAAGLASRARCGLQQRPEVRVLTWNLKDFNRSELKRADMSAWDPDRQISALMEQDPAGLALALRTVRDHALARGRDEPVTETLRRERLFRCGRLYASHGAFA